MPEPSPSQRLRRQAEARRVALAAYAHRCCVVCGEAVSLQVLHLDRQAENTSPDNLAFACPTHQAMFQAGLYPAPAIRLLRAHWQETRGVPVAAAEAAGVREARIPKRRTGLRPAGTVSRRS